MALEEEEPVMTGFLFLFAVDMMDAPGFPVEIYQADCDEVQAFLDEGNDPEDIVSIHFDEEKQNVSFDFTDKFLDFHENYDQSD